jgi:hypothetical protein
MKYTRESEGDFEEEGDRDFHPESGDAGVFWCPRCGSEMYGDADRCPTCGDYVTPGPRHASQPMPWWIWAIVALVAVAMLAGLVASFF